jgi:hypothetical protein
MAITRYDFVTNWTLAAPIDAVWNEISRPQDWPQWWRGVLSVVLLEPGDAEDLRAYRRIVMRSVLPYRLTFNVRTVRIERPHLIEGRSDGELCGTGCWHLAATAEGTAVRYDWSVETTKAWMRTLAPVARPIFGWNHNAIMRWGREGLERRLASR